MKTLAIIFLATIFMIVPFLIISLVAMFVWNQLALYFGFRAINYWIAIMITLASWLIRGPVPNWKRD